MKVGDIVTWTSQASGVSKEKTGEIIAVVPKGKSNAKIWTALGRKAEFRSFTPSTGTRDHDSYLVAVAAPTETSKPQVYWPVVSQLKKEADQEASLTHEESSEDLEDELGEEDPPEDEPEDRAES
jgi:hypothetical protein